MQILKTTNIKTFGKKYQGKVRDWYVLGNKRLLITTDRISAFDRVLGYIPYKGHVLSQLSSFWFEKTKDIISNHVLDVPDPNCMIVKNCKPIPIEMVVRGYMTGVTKTSIWGSYEKGERMMYGIRFPEGLRKNQKLPRPILTPTTKSEKGHDERLTRRDILKRKIVPEKMYEQMEKAARQLFKRGARICKKAGVVLVDTKYEFGLYNGKLMLIDEIHTPDSSRFWILKTYKERFRKGLEPENFDKEFLRLWYKNRGYTGDGIPPKMTRDLIVKTSKRYVAIYGMITKKQFEKPRSSITTRIQYNVKNYFPRIAVLISNSGTGTNLQAIIDAVQEKKLRAEVAVVISDAENAYGLIRAKKAGVKTNVLQNNKPLLNVLDENGIDIVVLAGWKRIITKDVLDAFPKRILNIHPGLIPSSKKRSVKNPDGTLAIWNKGKFMSDAVKNFLVQKATYAGSSVHVVTNAVDFGPVLGRCFEKIKSTDTVESLYARLKKKEHAIYIQVLEKLCS